MLAHGESAGRTSPSTSGSPKSSGGELRPGDSEGSGGELLRSKVCCRRPRRSAPRTPQRDRPSGRARWSSSRRAPAGQEATQKTLTVASCPLHPDHGALPLTERRSIIRETADAERARRCSLESHAAPTPSPGSSARAELLRYAVELSKALTRRARDRSERRHRRRLPDGHAASKGTEVFFDAIQRDARQDDSRGAGGRLQGERRTQLSRRRRDRWSRGRRPRHGHRHRARGERQRRALRLPRRGPEGVDQVHPAQGLHRHRRLLADVGEVDPEGSFWLHLIPETLRLTNLGDKGPRATGSTSSSRPAP